MSIRECVQAMADGRSVRSEFEAWIDHLLERIGGGPIILGVGDKGMGNSATGRLKAIARRVEQHAP
jgi:hypothetical protein